MNRPTPDSPPTTELLPCPHCGGSASHHRLDEPEDSPNWNGEIVGCDACGASTAVVFSDKESALNHLEVLWNRRCSPSPAPVAVDVDRVDAEVARLKQVERNESAPIFWLEVRAALAASLEEPK